MVAAAAVLVAEEVAELDVVVVALVFQNLAS